MASIHLLFFSPVLFFAFPDAPQWCWRYIAWFWGKGLALAQQSAAIWKGFGELRSDHAWGTDWAGAHSMCCVRKRSKHHRTCCCISCVFDTWCSKCSYAEMSVLGFTVCICNFGQFFFFLILEYISKLTCISEIICEFFSTKYLEWRRPAFDKDLC